LIINGIRFCRLDAFAGCFCKVASRFGECGVTLVVIHGKLNADIKIGIFIELGINRLRYANAAKSAPTYTKIGVAVIKISTI
jgi:hypothetical protein